MTRRIMTAAVAAVLVSGAGALRPVKEEISDGDFADVEPTSDQWADTGRLRGVDLSDAEARLLATRDPSLPPDRLCGEKGSPHYDEAAMKRGVRIRINGCEKSDVKEYCISEGWARHYPRNSKGLVTAGEGPMTTCAEIEAFWRRDENGKWIDQ